MRHIPLIFVGIYGCVFAWAIIDYDRVFLGDLGLMLSLLPWSLVLAPSWGWNNDALYWFVAAVEAGLNCALFYGIGMLCLMLFRKFKR